MGFGGALDGSALAWQGRGVLTILEVSNFVDPRVDDERQRAGAGRVRWVSVRPGAGTWTQARGREFLIEHVEGQRIAGLDQPVLVRPARLRALVQLHRPSVIVCGSPASMPALVQLSGLRLDPRPALIGAWQADALGGAVRRELGRVDERLAAVGGRALGWWTKQGLRSLDAVVVGSRSAALDLWGRGVDRIYVAPRGVDLERFSPDRAAPESAEALRAGGRMVICIDAPARADVELLPRLYAALCRGLARDPVVVVHAAGSEAVDRFGGLHPLVQVCGFADVELRARWLAACDVAVVLPGRDGGWGGCVEAMASGAAVVGVGDGVLELVRGGGCGRGFAVGEVGRVAEAVVDLGRWGGMVELGRKGRGWVERYEIEACGARELACYEEVLGGVRDGRGVAVGVHERMAPGVLADRAGPSNRD
ncbi:hypothetical protein DB30_07436 [Enhygromyxa salina]|uniref:Uncharacterized protein n=1 Tax=Enhygromyxa salina TaxID=215803 RepID=A0A0C1ZS33_9BACT|nr:hypothetical protein DB30_07436 [Enhygromyxa salina]